MTFLPRYVVSLALGSTLLLSMVACSDDTDGEPSATAGAGGSTAGAGGSTAGAGGSTAGAGGSNTGGSGAGAGGAAAGDIVATASGLADYSALVDLVAAAGLVDTLKGAGPFTVFAPNNAAFSKFLTDTGLTADDLKKPENKALLTEILTYHVSAQGSTATPATKGLFAAELTEANDISTVLGASAKTAFLDVNGSSNGVELGLAPPLPFFGSVKVADVAASNGVIHGIDAVLVPPRYVDYGATISFKAAGAKSSVVDLAVYASTVGLPLGGASPAKEFTILTGLVTKCNLASSLAGATDITVFAPTDAAFTKAGVTVAAADCTALSPVLTYHVVPSVAPASAAVAAAGSGTKLPTLNGKQLGFKIADGKLLVDDTSAAPPAVVLKNIQTSNAIVHAIDGVLTPPS